jgi:hypothetical protein
MSAVVWCPSRCLQLRLRPFTECAAPLSGSGRWDDVGDHPLLRRRFPQFGVLGCGGRHEWNRAVWYHPNAMGRPEEHFSVEYTLPRLRDLFLRELKLAGIESGLDECLPCDVSPEPYELLAVAVRERFCVEVREPASPASGDQPEKCPGHQSQAVRLFYLARAFLRACAYAKNCAVAASIDDLVHVENEIRESYRRAREYRLKVQGAIHGLETVPFPRKDWGPLIAELRECAAAFESVSLPPDLAAYPTAKAQEKIFQLCRDEIARLLGETKLPDKDLAPVYYDDFAKNPDSVCARFRKRRQAAWAHYFSRGGID